MNKKELTKLIPFFLIGILSRFPFIEKFQSHWDGPQYSIAVVRYSLMQETPAPPGYPLYIGVAKIINFLIHNPHTSLLLEGVLFSGFGAVLFYLLGKKIVNARVGIIASLLFLSGSTFYFFGLTAYPYGITPVFAAITAYFVYEIVVNKKQVGIFLGVAYSLNAGIRPQDGVLLLPLFLFGLYHLGMKQKLHAIVSVIVLSVGWLIPLTYTAGGLKSYMDILHAFAVKGALPSVGFPGKQTVEMMLKGIFLSFGVGILALIPYGKIFIRRWDKRAVFFCFWIIPGVLFNTFVRSDHAGHQMVYLSGVLVLIAWALWSLGNKKGWYALTTFVVLFNLFTFFRDRDSGDKRPYIPTSFHYSEIIKNDEIMWNKLTFTERMYDPKTTIVVANGDLWRPIMYYLKNYHVYNLEGLATSNSDYLSVVRIGYDWNRTEYSNKNMTFEIPEGITKVVFLDDGDKDSIISKNKKAYYMPPGIYVTELPVAPHEIFTYHKGEFKEKAE